MKHKYALFMIDIGLEIEARNVNYTGATPPAREAATRRLEALKKSRDVLVRDAETRNPEPTEETP